ncbi:MAG: hypothetical protein ACE5J2_07120 [Nitrososphaerales archaeon]
MKIELQTVAEGKVAATFIASSIAIIVIGILVFIRKQLPWLELYSPAGTFSGIWFYSYVLWGILWLGLFLLLRRRESAGSIKTWLILFFASLAVATVLIEMSLKWSLVFG